jgi:HTH-type transcriptional regulator/antitoxin HigA
MAAPSATQPNFAAPEDFAPDWAVPPGRLIQRELEAAGLSQAEVASRASLSAKHLNQVLKGHVTLSPEVAVALERVLDGAADLWLRMDVSWQAARTREDARRAFGTMAGWVQNFPLHVMSLHGVVKADMSVTDQVEALLRFFRVAEPEAFERVWLSPQANYKRSQKFDIDPFATATWLRLAELAAVTADYDSPATSPSDLRAVAREIPALTRLPLINGFQHAQELLAAHGVVLVFVPEISGTRICGASRLLPDGRPMIALTGRYNFLDSFWFTMLHEIGHLVLHPKRATFLDLDRKGASDDSDTQETAANDFARSLVLPKRYEQGLRAVTTKDELVALADVLNVAPGVLAGQYGHATGDWGKFGKLRERTDIAATLAKG